MKQAKRLPNFTNAFRGSSPFFSPEKSVLSLARPDFLTGAIIETRFQASLPAPPGQGKSLPPKTLPSNHQKLALLRAKVRISVSSLFWEKKTVLTLKMDGEHLTNLQMNTLLNHFTAHCVQIRRDERKEASSSWKPIVDDILEYVKERNGYLASLEILYSGSSYEGTKVGEPDEFDLMLVMNNVVFREIKELPGVNKPPKGGLNWIAFKTILGSTRDRAIISHTLYSFLRIEDLSTVPACV